MDYRQVKGFSKLSKKVQDIFKKTYRKHSSIIGESYKSDWIPTSVKLMGNYLKVTFKNGEWLHYIAGGNWY